MKKSDIERQLKKDLSESAPSDFNAVWNKCTTPEVEEKQLAAQPVQVAAGNHSAHGNISRSTKILSVATAFLLCIATAICLIIFLKSGSGLYLPTGSGYFVIDVNPSMQVNYDANGVVTAKKGLNSDGEEMLAGLELEGLTYDLAADAIFDACVERGYFLAERDDNAILITANKDSGEKDEAMTAKINERLAQKFADKNMKGVVISDVDNSKSSQKEAEKYGINGQKYELIMRYLDMGGVLDESEYATISIRELSSLISQLEKGSKDK